MSSIIEVYVTERAKYGTLSSDSIGLQILLTTPSVPNYRTFDYFNPKFDHSFYSKNLYIVKF